MQAIPTHPLKKLEIKLKEQVQKNKEVEQTITLIVNKVKELTDAPDDWLTNRTRIREYVEPRRVLMFVLMKRVRVSQAVLSSFFGWDRTTFLAHTKKTQNIMDIYSDYAEYILQILDEVDNMILVENTEALERAINNESTKIIRRKAKRKMATINQTLKEMNKLLEEWDMQGYQKRVLMNKVGKIKSTIYNK